MVVEDRRSHFRDVEYSLAPRCYFPTAVEHCDEAQVRLAASGHGVGLNPGFLYMRVHSGPIHV